VANFVETQEAAKWLLATLQADATVASYLGTGGTALMFNRQAPPVLPTPSSYYLVFQLQGGPLDAYAAGRPGGASNFRIASKLVYAVKIIGQTEDVADLEPVYKAVDAAIDNQAGDTSAARVHCSRVGAFEFSESDGPNQTWWHLGGLYQFIVTAL
jgi:hypothetical protein